MKVINSGLAVLGMLSTSAMAQNMSYGADNFYVSDMVTRENITFPTLYQTNVTGTLFTPNDLDYNTSTAAIVVGHPMGAVKEQSANLYATMMAERGFVAVSIDLPYWGGSEGEPPNAVSAEFYAEAFSAAVDYLGLQDFVDRERIGGIGICGSGSFIISAAKIDPRLKAIATSSMYDMGAVSRNGLQNAQSLEVRRQLIAETALQRWNESAGAATQYTGGTPLEITEDSDPIAREFYDFYRTPRGEYTPEGLPEGVITTQPTLTSNTKFMNFYPFNDIETISPRPMLFIAGDQAHSREFSEDAYYLANEPKELLWIPGAGHADLYDRVELIPFDRLGQFFQTNLVEADY